MSHERKHYRTPQAIRFQKLDGGIDMMPKKVECLGWKESYQTKKRRVDEGRAHTDSQDRQKATDATTSFLHKFHNKHEKASCSKKWNVEGYETSSSVEIRCLKGASGVSVYMSYSW